MNDISRNLHALIDDAERLLQHATREAGSEFEAARARLEKSIEAGKARLHDAGAAANEGVHHAGHAADGFVRHNPWPVVGGAIVIGLLAGWILGARR